MIGLIKKRQGLFLVCSAFGKNNPSEIVKAKKTLVYVSTFPTFRGMLYMTYEYKTKGKCDAQ